MYLLIKLEFYYCLFSSQFKIIWLNLDMNYLTLFTGSQKKAHCWPYSGRQNNEWISCLEKCWKKLKENGESKSTEMKTLKNILEYGSLYFLYSLPSFILMKVVFQYTESKI